MALKGTAFSRVCSVTAVIVYHVIEQVYLFFFRLAGIAASAESRCAVGVVCQQIVVERSSLTAPYTSVAVCSFFMNGIGKAFAYVTPLEGEVAVVIECGAFVRAPTHGAVVDDDILMRFRSVHGIVAFLLDVNSHT